MPRLPAPPETDRFFARPEAGRNECPRCGYLDQWYTPGPVRGQVGNPAARLAKRPNRSKGSAAAGRSASGWNPLTSRWQCPSCRMTFQVGLLFWPVLRGGGQAPSIPRDQVVDYRQMTQLRAQAEGRWMREGVKGWRAPASNLTASWAGMGLGEVYAVANAEEAAVLDRLRERVEEAGGG